MNDTVLTTQVEETEQGKIGGLKEKVDYLTLLMVGVIFVLFVGFASMYVAFAALLQSSNSDRQSSFENLREQVQTHENRMNDKIDRINKEMRIVNPNQ
jgi:beta-lactamase regulating signal transducer with metallopeptidase domain